MMLLSWLCGGLFALCGALCYGEMGAKFPHAGCEYVFLRESFGKLMGFLSGWISLLVGFSAPIAAAAIAFSTYCFRAFGITVGPNIPIEVFGVPVAVISMVNLTAIMVIVGFSLLHYHSLVNGSRIQNCLTVFNFSLVFVFIIAGFAFGYGSTAYFLETSGMRDFSAESFAVALIFVSFSYSGWNAAAYLGGEIKKPQRNIPLSMVCGTILVTGLYLLLNSMYVYSISIFATLTVIGMMRIRKTRPELICSYRTFGYPFTPLVFITGNLWIIIYMIKSRPVNALFGLATIGAGLVIYGYFALKEKEVELSSPVSKGTIEETNL